jgi:hypothetical protein
LCILYFFTAPSQNRPRGPLYSRFYVSLSPWRPRLHWKDAWGERWDPPCSPKVGQHGAPSFPRCCIPGWLLLLTNLWLPKMTWQKDLVRLTSERPQKVKNMQFCFVVLKPNERGSF